MKSKEEILKRTVVLLAFSDRCALEKEVIGGVRRSLNEREMQRQAIVDWLIRMKYYDSAFENEKKIFNEKISSKRKDDIIFLQSNYECLEPMLWSLGLVGELSSYDGFVLRDFHPILRFGKNHSIKVLLEITNAVLPEKIKECREISMLWYWRCLEYRNELSPNNVKESIYNVFGEYYLQLLNKYEQFDNISGDFFIKGKMVGELNEDEIAELLIISERRFYAFEWLSSNLDWDSIDLVC